MRSGPSLSRLGVLLITIVCPLLLGAEFRCVALSNPTVATARIDQIEPTALLVGEVMQASGSGNGTPPLQFAWDFGDGTGAPGTQAAHAYLAPGTYRVTFTVHDANGNTGRDSSQVTVSPRLPSSVPDLLLLSDAVAGQPVRFAALPLEERAGELAYVWTFSGGQSAVGSQAAAIFPAEGMYLASVAASNDQGAVAVAQMAFHVADAAH
jgi:hypothetical protein